MPHSVTSTKYLVAEAAAALVETRGENRRERQKNGENVQPRLLEGVAADVLPPSNSSVN